MEPIFPKKHSIITSYMYSVCRLKSEEDSIFESLISGLRFRLCLLVLQAPALSEILWDVPILVRFVVFSCPQTGSDAAV